MSYATLMLHVDVDDDLHGHVAIATALAERFRAHVIGVGGWAPMSVFLADAARQGITPPAPNLQDMKALLDQKGEKFCATLAAPGRTVEWRSVLDYPADAIVREARSADLIIAQRTDRPRDPFRVLDIGHLVLNAGRPVLLVPPQQSSLPLKRAAIAWKDTREARRAVRDALPLLKSAASVLILEVGERAGDHGPRRADDVARYIGRLGVETVTARAPLAEVTVIDTLLHTIQIENVDLLVAGAYGHSRLGEWIFGGVTRDLLTRSPIACLFSH